MSNHITTYYRVEFVTATKALNGKPVPGGTIQVTNDGLLVDCDDDFYSGTLTKDEARQLAYAILGVHSG